MNLNQFKEHMENMKPTIRPKQMEEARALAHSVGPMDFGSTEAIKIIATALALRDAEIAEEKRLFTMKQNDWIEVCKEVDALKESLATRDKEIEAAIHLLKQAEYFFAHPEEYEGADQAELHMRITDHLQAHDAKGGGK